MNEYSKFNAKAKIFIEHLQDLAGIKLTMREVDIVACILHNRGEKKIASLLDISYRTVSSHVRNIMNKFACNSRDQIIDAIEKSGRLKYLRQYYFYLVMQGDFINRLKKIGSTINRAGILYSVNYAKSTREEEKYLKQIEQHLTLANINLSSNTKDANKDICNLFIIRDAENLVDNNKQNIGLLLDDNVNQERLLGLEYIDFRNVGNYYLAILLLVNKIIESSEIEKIISEFKIEQASLCSSLKVTEINSLDAPPSAKKIYKSKIIALFVSLVIILSSWFFINNTWLYWFSSPEVTAREGEWNMPQPIDNYTQRPSLTKAVWEKFRQSKMDQDNIAVITGLHGLGGIGKTTLAKHAINYPEKKYSFRGWFSSETKNLLLADYLGLGEQQNLFTQDNISVSRKVLLVKQWLESQSNALLVYDNVDDMEVLRDYLPKKGDIIITSRNPNIPGAIEIDVMDEEEALNLLDNLMPKSIKKHSDYTKNIKILASTLEYLPLAIAQAGTYIRENMLSIQDYLILYATEQNILLSDETMPTMDDHKPAYISWDLAIKKIEIEKDGKQAIELLNVISCCYPEHIPKKLLAQYLYNNTDNTSMVRLNKILTLLRKYSLIKTSSDSISVHRLVHSWLGSKLHRNTSNTTLYEKLCKALNVITPKLSEDQNEDGHIINTLYPHINKILKTDLVENQNVLLEKADLFNKLGLYNQHNLYQVNKALVYYDSAEEIYNKLKHNNANLAKVLMNQGWCYFITRNLEKALSKFDQVLKLLDRSVPSEMQANALRGKGLVYDQQKWRESKEDSLRFHMEAYEIYQKLYSGKDHHLLATAMHNIAWYYKDRYKEDQSNNFDPDIVFEWFDKSLAMRRRLFKGSMHPDIASSLNSIGDLYRKLGGQKNLQLALDYQLQALKIRESLSGGRLNHYMIGSYSRLGETYEDMGNYEKSLEFNEKMLIGTYKLYDNYQHVHIMGSLLRIADLQEKLGNMVEAIEYYKKAYIILLRNNYDSRHPRSKQHLNHLRRLVPEFLDNPDDRIFITRRGAITKERYDIKARIQDKILNKLHNCCAQGLWKDSGRINNWFRFKKNSDIVTNAGAMSYISDDNIKEVYGSRMTNNQLKIAKELCFEAINFSIMSRLVSKGQERDLTCFIEFAKKNPDLVKQLADEHPEYFVDGLLLIEAAKMGIVTDDQVRRAIGPAEYPHS